MALTFGKVISYIRTKCYSTETILKELRYYTGESRDVVLLVSSPAEKRRVERLVSRKFTNRQCKYVTTRIDQECDETWSRRAERPILSY